MIDFKVVIGGIESAEMFRGVVHALSKEMKGLTDTEMRKFAYTLQSKARFYAPQRKWGSVIATGKLKSSIRVHGPYKRKDRTTYRVYVSARGKKESPYGIYQEIGTKKRRARGKMEIKLPRGRTAVIDKMMVFRDSRTGRWVMKKEVRGIGKGDIGRKTRLYMHRAFAETIKEIDVYKNPEKVIDKAYSMFWSKRGHLVR